MLKFVCQWLPQGSLGVPRGLPQSSPQSSLEAPSEVAQCSPQSSLRSPSELREGSLEAPSMLSCQLKAQSSLRARP